MDSNGKLGFNEQDYQILSEKERDQNNALDKKLDKKPQSGYHLYGDHNGVPSYPKYSVAAEFDTIPFRGGGGTISTGNPFADSHATTKKYVDDIKTELLAAIQALREELSK